MGQRDQIGQHSIRHSRIPQEAAFRSCGSELFYQAWRPGSAPRAVLVITHGLGEHGGRYARLVDHLVPRGFAVYAFDHRGHGRSPGQRGHVASWDQYHRDLDGFLRKVRREVPDVPLFLLGHSMGALIGLDYALEGSPEDAVGLSGLILSGVPLDPVGVAKPWLVSTARLLSRVLPRVPMRVGLDPAALSREPEVVQSYRDDPLVHAWATPRWGTEALAAIGRAGRNLARLRLPLLVIHGGADRLSSPEGARALAAGAGSSDKTLRIYEGACHEPHNDLCWEEVVEDVASWMEARL